MTSKNLKPRLIVISGPSGVGKTSICKMILEKATNFYWSISATTRIPRKGEVNGQDYFFISEEDFQEKVKTGEFLEYAKVHNCFYGTYKTPIDKSLDNGNSCLIEIDVQGAKQIMRKREKEPLFIFILPPDPEELKKRLSKRGSETEKNIEIRINNAKKELEAAKDYQYSVVNKNLEESVEKILEIMRKENIV